MKTLLTANLSTKEALAGTEAWVPPTFVFGETLTLALRFSEDVNGETVEPSLDIRGIYAGIGLVDLRPASGEWALQVGPGPQTGANTTATVAHDCTAAQLAAAINEKTAIVSAYGAPKVEKEDGSWRIRFGAGAAQVQVRVVSNRLRPMSVGRSLAAQIDGEWWHEVRLVQSPLAFTTTSERILPPPPSVTRLASGGSDGGFTWNEVQALYVPPDFRGTYLLKIGDYIRTAELSVDDTAETMQAALEAAAGENFKVTNPREFTAHIEFTGIYAGVAQELIEVVPLNPPAGDLTFSLALDRAALHARLRSQPEIVVPLEVRIQVADEYGEISERVAFRQDVTIVRPLLFPELALVPDIDYLRPLSPKDYVPFNRLNVITGQQFYPIAVGDGVATEFVIAHGLATEAVFVWVRENVSGGMQLVPGADYEVEIDSADQVKVTALGDIPTAGAWMVTVVSAQTVAAFADGLEITIGQVTGLQDLLDQIGAQLQTLLDLAPTTPLGTSTSATASTLVIDIPARQELYPRQGSLTVDLKNLPRPLALLPAVHGNTLEPISLTGALPDVEASAGIIYKNDTGGPLMVPGRFGMNRSIVAAGGHVASDGRRFFPVTRVGTTTSYFPRDFERELWMFQVNSSMLRAASTLKVEFSLGLQLLQATSRAQYHLVIEHGVAPSQGSLLPVATNMDRVEWNATPLLKQRIVVGPVKVTHTFGAQIIRAATGVLSANKVLYGFASAADSTPTSPDLALRARLIDWDTETGVVDARGTVFLDLHAAQATIK